MIRREVGFQDLKHKKEKNKIKGRGCCFKNKNLSILHTYHHIP